MHRIAHCELSALRMAHAVNSSKWCNATIQQTGRGNMMLVMVNKTKWKVEADPIVHPSESVKVSLTSIAAGAGRLQLVNLFLFLFLFRPKSATLAID